MEAVRPNHQTGGISAIHVVPRDPKRDRNRPKERLPYLCIRGGQLTLIVDPSVTTSPSSESV